MGMGILENLATRLLNKAEITLKVQISPTVWHIRLKSDAIAKVDYIPGHFLRILAGKGKDMPIREKVRSYSVWNMDKANNLMDLAVCIHSDGPGSTWARECNTGDTVYFAWKKGNFIVNDTADTYIFIGDLSTLGHLYEIHRNLPEKKRILSLVYSQEKADFFADIDGSRPFDFYELPENPGGELISRLAELAGTASGKTMAYIGGDSRVCISVTQYLRNELHWQRSQINAKPFWNPEKKGLE
jgi:NADPH-dependent ferric siderophore reductase